MDLVTLEKELVFESTHHKLFYFTEVRALMMQPTGDVPEDDFKTTHLEVLRIAQTREVKIMLVNETELKSIPTKSRIWLTTKLMRRPEAKEIAKKVTDVYIIKSSSMFANSLTKMIHQVASRITGMKFHYLATEEEALASINSYT